MEKPNSEYHELIEHLTDQKFYGDLTLHFQAGIIDHSLKIERNTTKEIREQLEAKKHRKVKVRTSDERTKAVDAVIFGKSETV